MADDFDQNMERAPSQLRSLAESMAVMGVVTGIALLVGETGRAGEWFAGVIVISTGAMMKLKTELDNYHRATGPYETNAEYLQMIVTAIKGLKRSKPAEPVEETEPMIMPARIQTNGD